ncbi:MAG: hypothetical protein ABIH69_01180 [bacterium]|nr:hypothetical protein [Candidatus Margulisiibacteriota bacterium]
MNKLIMLSFLFVFIVAGCANVIESYSVVDSEVSSGLETFTRAYQVADESSLATVVSADYADLLTNEGYSVEASYYILTREASYIASRFPIDKYELSLTGVNVVNGQKEASFTLDIYGHDVEFPVFNYVGKLFATAIFTQEGETWLINKVRVNRGVVSIILDGIIDGSSRDEPQISLLVYNFSSDAALGGTDGEPLYYWGSIPFPIEGTTMMNTVEVSGLGEPTVSGYAGWCRGPIGFGALYSRPILGTYPMAIKIKTLADENIDLNFNYIVHSASAEVER